MNTEKQYLSTETMVARPERGDLPHDKSWSERVGINEAVERVI